MGDKTDIAWTDATWNPVAGCSRVSAGCEHCYAEALSWRFAGPGQRYHGLVVKGKQGPRWSGVLRLEADRLAVPLQWKRGRRIFVNSMSDLFHENLSNEQIAAVFGVMAACPQHTFQVLTKRPERMRQWFQWLEQQPEFTKRFLHPALIEHAACLAGNNDRLFAAANERAGRRTWPLPNVWLGVSIENQQTATARIPLLIDTPAALRWVSYEPALEPIFFEDVDEGQTVLSPECWGDCNCPPDPGCRRQGGDGYLTRRIDWVVVGGESGPHARPFDIQIVRDLLKECRFAGVPVFVKQLGARPFNSDEGAPLGTDDPSDCAWLDLNDRKGADMAEWPEDLRVREFPQEGGR